MTVVKANDLGKESVRNIDRLVSEGLSGEEVVKSRGSLVADGRLTDYGRWAVEKFPEEAVAKIRSGELKGLSQKEVEYLHSKGVPAKELVGQQAIVENGKLTSFGRLAFEKFPEEAIKKMNASNLMGLPVEDLKIIRASGMPMKDIMLLNAVIKDGSLTEVGRWSLQESPVETLQKISRFEVKELRGSDLKFLMDNGYSPAIISKDGSDQALRELGAKVRVLPNGSRQVTLPTVGRVAPVEEPVFRGTGGPTKFEVAVRGADGNPEKLEQLRKQYLQDAPDPKNNVSSAVYRGLDSNDPKVSAFAKQILAESPELRVSVGQSALINKRADLFQQIPFEPQNPVDQRYFKKLEEINQKGSKGFIADEAKRLRSQGVARPSGQDINESLKANGNLGKLNIAEAMEEMKLNPSQALARMPNPAPVRSPGSTNDCEIKALEALLRSKSP